MREKQAPHVEKTTGPTAAERLSHPAFGMVSVVKGTCSDPAELFGSDLRHRQVITLTLSTAHIDRHLNRDWLHEGKTVASIEMTEAQWAAVITSQNGTGVPVTFVQRAVDDAPLQLCPRIEKEETKSETFSREMRERCESYLGDAQKLNEVLESCLTDGKASKATLKELQALASRLSNGLPQSMAFVQDQFSKSMAQTVAEGKIEVEAFMTNIVHRAGLQHLQLQGEAPTLITNDVEKDA